MAADVLDPELQAIAMLLATLQPLNAEARSRVITYVFEKLGIVAPGRGGREQGSTIADAGSIQSLARGTPSAHNLAPPLPAGSADIRSLKEKKNPQTVTEMVAVMAYYLAHEAPLAERSETIAPEDVKKYFMQANFPLPKAAPGMTLVNTKNAGYIDARGDGRYSLNAVGHNLVVHKLPKAADASTMRRSRKKVADKTNKGRRKTKK